MKNCKSCEIEISNRATYCTPCGKIAKYQRDLQWLKNHPDKRKQYSTISNRTPYHRYQTLVGNAKKRNLDCTLLPEQFYELIKLPCHYCNNFLNVDTGAGSSLDRIDNSQGYTPDNVLPCCGTCNKIKSNTFDMHETKIMVSALISYKEKLINDNK